jgi:hypothetical protein
MAPLEIAELESRMRPGAFSRAGFLGPQENLLQVLEADRQQVARMGLTFEQLAEPLEALIAAGVSSPSRKANVGKVYRVEVEVLTGFQICPWAADPHHAQCTAGKGVQNASVNWHHQPADRAGIARTWLGRAPAAGSPFLPGPGLAASCRSPGAGGVSRATLRIRIP